eukprot:GHVS01042417.1.p2 GENE.GHVS01042417.1~~GHVS01042417.1.p2  ORF type:complete len:301 (+),score=57.62 GHVS01042417.1:1166-2068(+)
MRPASGVDGGGGEGLGSYSPEQEEISRKVLSTSSYYDILGVTKRDSEDAIKKAYKKLALQLHPDKNNAPSAEESFKKVSRAFQCLTDVERRKVYDQYGTEDETVQSGASQQAQYEHDVMTPEELFRAFFGVDFAGGGGGFHRPRVYRRPAPPRPSNNEDQHRLYGLIQLIPVLLLFTITFFSNLFPSSHVRRPPPYSFSRSVEYSLPRNSRRSEVPYYVPKDFEQLMYKNQLQLSTFEDDVELSFFTNRCEFEEREILKKVKLLQYGGTAGSDEKINDLFGKKRPSCEKLRELQYILAQR